MDCWVTVKECAGLPGLPGREQNIRARLVKASGGNPELQRKREGSKAFEFHIACLPHDAQEALRQRHYKSVLEQPGCKSVGLPVKRNSAVKPREELEIMRQCPALVEREVATLTDDQKKVADARALLAQEVEKLRAAGMSRIAAVTFIADGSRQGTLPARVMVAAGLANARKGSSRVGVSKSCLQEWLTIYLTTKPGLERLALLAPGQPKRKRPEDVVWFYGMFWPHYSNQNGPSVKEAYRSFKREWFETYSDQPAMLMALPSYDAVIRLVDKLPLRERMRGRVTGSAAKAFEVYQQRDWSQMPVNGCWISDGKSLNLKVAHPIHGRPFTPELTLVIDGRTRYIVGWSVSLAENAIAVADAYRHAMKHHGKPLFVYSDNGGGETNKMLDADITGIFPRLHIEHMTGIPGNPQARGIIERLNGVMPDRLAKRFLTYNGIGADPNAVRIRGQQMLSLSNALRDGRELTAQNKKTLKILPTWRQLIDAVQEEIDEYNNSHEHSELPKVNGKWMSPAAYRQWVLEQEGDDIEYMTDGELREMFMPEVIRVAQRGWIALENNQYFSKELINVDRQEVRVAFDIHDPNEVIIRQMDGTYVCTAIWNGNTASPVPVAKVQKALEERAKRKIKLAETKIQDAEDELRPALEHKADTDFSKFIPAESEPERISSKPYLFESEYEDDLKKYGNHR